MREFLAVSNVLLHQYGISSDECTIMNTSAPPLSTSYKHASDLVENMFGYRPCLWQIRVVEALLRRDKDVVSISWAKTFWMPLLLVLDGTQIVVAPPNILGKPNLDSLQISLRWDTQTRGSIRLWCVHSLNAPAILQSPHWVWEERLHEHMWECSAWQKVLLPRFWLLIHWKIRTSGQIKSVQGDMLDVVLESGVAGRDGTVRRVNHDNKVWISADLGAACACVIIPVVVRLAIP